MGRTSETSRDPPSGREPTVSPLPQALAKKALADRGEIEGQRRQVTVLFADMAGYTPLAERLGEEGTYLLMQRVIREMSEAVHENEGTVQELTGDGLMALFGAPVALEDAPVRACRAALGIQVRMAALAGEFEAEYGARPEFRVGLHSGPVVIGKVGDDSRMEFTALGDTVNLASRLEGAAESGAVVISEATHGLVEGYVETEFLGERELKGKKAPQKIWRLAGLKAGVTRFDISKRRGLTPLVGRRRELEAVESCWAEAEAGAVRVVDIIGEAGMGKSRLIHEFRAWLGDDAFFLEGHCAADGRTTPFLPFIEVMRTSFRIEMGTERAEAARKLARGTELLGLDPGETLPYVLNILGYEAGDGALDELAGEVLGIRTRDAILALLRARARATPTVLFIEDLHWIDTASEELLRRAAVMDGNLSLLIVCASRPEYEASWPGGAEVSELRLGPLSSGSTTDLLKERLGTEELPEGLTRLVVGKAEGNPLFAEEITNYLMDAGRLRADDAGIAYDAGAEATGIPVTLENLLLDRFDRLDKGPRAALEAAAVIGQRFSLDLLGRVTDMNGELAPHLAELMRQELIFREGQRGDFRFKHALVQDAIYNSLLTQSRATLHERAAVAIERSRSASLSEFVDILADHYNHTPRAEKTAHYMALAGARSLQVYSLEEAELRFRRVIELIEDVPGCADDTFLADVLLKMARVHYYRADFKKIMALVERYLGRMEALGDKRRLSRLLFEVGYAHVFSAGGATGKNYLERALALGEELVDDESIGYACLGLMFNYVFWTEPSDENRTTFIELGDRVMAIAEKSDDTWLAAKCLNCRWGEATFFSRFAEARDYCTQLFELSREKNDPRPMGFGLWQMAIINLYNDQYQEAIENADESLGIALSPLDRLCARSAKGGAYALIGRAQEGFETLGEIHRQSEALGFVVLIMMIDVFYGASMGLAGNLGTGIGWIKDSIKRSEAWGNHNMPALGHLVLGEIYLQMAIGEEKPPLSVILKNLGFVLTNLPVAALKSRRHFDEAIRMSRKVNMPGHLARSLLGLGLLYKAKKRAPQARACLEEAQEIAKTVRADNIVEKVQAALSSL